MMLAKGISVTKRKREKQQGEPIDKAAERLRQFERSRLPQTENTESEILPKTSKPNDAQKTLEPLPSNQIRGSLDERSKR